MNKLVDAAIVAALLMMAIPEAPEAPQLPPAPVTQPASVPHGDRPC